MGSDEHLPTRSDLTGEKPAYSVVDVSVEDPIAFAQYVKGHWETVQKYGGRFLVAGGRIETIEGDWVPRKVVIHQWPNAAAFHRWHNSEEYRPWKELRRQAAQADVILVEGLADVGTFANPDPTSAIPSKPID